MMRSIELHRYRVGLRFHSSISIEQQIGPVAKSVATAIVPTLAFVALAALASCVDPNPASTVIALSTPTAVECDFVSRAALADVRMPIEEAIALSDIDKAQNGVTGVYASAAVTANDYLRAARAKIVAMDDLMTENGPVIYSMGPWYSFGSSDAWNQLDSGTWWLQVSASYHLSLAARQAIELASDAMERVATLRVHSVRCYVDAYQPLP